jgi:hypothetical protein
MIPIQQFRENQRRFPAEELAKYNGLYVAWSPDGTRILASDRDMVQLYRAVQAAGHDLSQILIDGPIGPEDVHWGGPPFLPEDRTQ